MKITVIIPIYNSENYLKKCIDYILKQSFEGFEILLINDGSTDNSGKICDEYAEKDSRIKVFHQKNCGVSAARNLGLQNAKGEYICFIDSDDSVNENYINDLIAGIVDNKTDLVVQGFLSINKEQEYEIAFGNDFINAKEYRVLFEEKEIFKYGYPFSKLFKAEIINKYDIRFPENYSFAEDLSFFLTYLSKCRLIKFGEKYNYTYFSHPNSLSKTVKKPREYFNRYVDYKEIIKDNFPEVFTEIYGKNLRFKEFTRSVGGSVFYYMQSLYLNKLQKTKRIEHLKNLKEDDFILIRNFIKHLNHPMYKFAFSLLTKKQYYLADKVLKFFMK